MHQEIRTPLGVIVSDVKPNVRSKKYGKLLPNLLVSVMYDYTVIYILL